MALKFEEIDSIPPPARRGRKAGGIATEITSMLRATPTGAFAVTAEGDQEDEDIQRLYRTLIQAKMRKPNVGYGVRRAGGTVYVWLVEEAPPAVDVPAAPEECPTCGQANRAPGLPATG